MHLALPREDQAALVKEARALDAARAALEAGAALGGLPAEQRQLVTAFYRRCAELKARLAAPAARRTDALQFSDQRRIARHCACGLLCL